MSNTTNILPHCRLVPAASVGIVLFCSLSLASTFCAATGQAPKPKITKIQPVRTPKNVVDQKTYKYLELGRKLYESQHYERSISCFDSAIRISPETGVAYYYRGSAQLATGREEEALLDLDRAISLNKNDFDSYLSRARAYLTLANYGKAFSDLNQCKRLNPKNAEVYSELGKLCAENRDWHGAIENFTKQSVIASRPREGLLRRAAAFSALGRDRDAANDYLTILKQYPTDRECIERLLICFERLGKV